jgi:hypothetical protein
MFQMRFGYYWSRICPDEADNGAELPGTTGNSSMRCFGFCVQVRHGAIFRPVMGIGKTRIGDFAAGAITVSGRHCWNSLSMNLILNGS